MARVTIEDCLLRVPNRFSLVHLTVERARQLQLDAEPLVESKNKEVVTALREIAANKITIDVDVEDIITGKVEKKERRTKRRRR